MYEHRTNPLLPPRQYVKRLAKSGAIGSGLIAVSLALGMLGYHGFEQLAWIDAFVNAAMILSGMGPLAAPATVGGKLFAGCYALYSGLVLLIAAGVLVAPVFHRFLHRFHLEQQDQAKDADDDSADADDAPPSKKKSAPSRRPRGGRTARA